MGRGRGKRWGRNKWKGERGFPFLHDFIFQDQPFFLMMSYDEVHVPLFASNSFLNTVSQYKSTYVHATYV